MLTPQEIEAIIEDTGGVPVVIGDVSTWGHVDQATETFGAGGGLSSDGGTPPAAEMVRVAAGITGDPVVGGQIQVDGVARLVRAWRLNSHRDEILILLAERTHIISIFARQGLDAEDDFGVPETTWVSGAASVAVNLEPVSGTVLQEQGGRMVSAEWRGFIPPGIPVLEDDRILVLSGVGPARYRVTFVAERGPGWDTEVELVTTTEVFP